LGIGDWAQSPIPNPQSPIPNPHNKNIFSTKKNKIIKKYIYKLNNKEKNVIFFNNII
jgi:hypothetical protein